MIKKIINTTSITSITRISNINRINIIYSITSITSVITSILITTRIRIISITNSYTHSTRIFCITSIICITILALSGWVYSFLQSWP